MNKRQLARRTPTALATVVLACSVLGACGSDESGDKAGSEIKIEVVVPNAAAYWGSVICGVKSEAKAAGAKVQVQNGKEYTATDQIPLLNASLARNPDGLVIVPADSKGMLAPLRQAKQDGVKIATAGIGLDPEQSPDIVTAEVITDDIGGGVQVADALAKEIGEKGTVLVMGTVAGMASTDARVDGIKQGLANYPNIKVLPVEYNKNEANTAAAIVNSTLSAHPDLAGIAANNLVGVNGAVTGLRQEKVAGGKVKLVGFDADPPEIEALEAGDVQALVVANPEQLGVSAAKQLIAAINGDKAEPKVTVDNTLVTKANMGDPKVKPLLGAPTCQ